MFDIGFAELLLIAVVGLLVIGWLVVSVIWMAREIIRMSRGTQAEVLAWTMPAAMLGYVSWSFLEFTLNDKPFWEFLSLYTALYLILRRLKAEGKELPSWESPLPRLWSR